MRVHFISNKFDGCQIVRCLHPMIYNGWSGDKTSLRTERIDQSESLKIALNSDVVVFHRPDDEKKLQAAVLLKKLGKKIVFDNDDTYKEVDNMKLGKMFKEKTEYLDRFIDIADLVTTTTEYLAKEYREISDKVEVIPNCIDPNDWDTPLRNKGNKVRIGLFGSTTINGDCYPVKEALQELSKRDNVTIVMFGLPAKDLQTDLIKDFYKDDFNFWDKINIEWHPFVPAEDYYRTLNELRLDIALIPRKDNYFNRCKSNLKFLEASMLEIPCIAQGFEDGNSPYQGKDEKYMVIVKDNNKWLEEIDKLIKDKKLRVKIGKEAKKYVLKNYNIIKNAKNWLNIYKKYVS